jgi:hypothetical protein
MEQLAQKLREALGLSADATEEQIIAAFSAARGTQAAQAADREALSKALEEQKGVVADLGAELKRLSAESEARATTAWKETLAAGVDDFRWSPAEQKKWEPLTGAARDAIRDNVMALREKGAMKPTPAIVTGTKTPASTGTAVEGLSAAQLEAVEAFKKANPTVGDDMALMGAMRENPALFAEAV